MSKRKKWLGSFLAFRPKSVGFAPGMKPLSAYLACIFVFASTLLMSTVQLPTGSARAFVLSLVPVRYFAIQEPCGGRR